MFEVNILPNVAKIATYVGRFECPSNAFGFMFLTLYLLWMALNRVGSSILTLIWLPKFEVPSFFPQESSMKPPLSAS